MVHGWDLVRATGQEPTWDDEVLTFVYREVEKTAEQGRDMGAYADRVPVSDTASGTGPDTRLTGRDPSWGLLR